MSIEIYSPLHGITSIDFSIGGFRANQGFDYGSWFLGTMRFNLHDPYRARAYYSNFPQRSTEGDWCIVVQALLAVALGTDYVFTVRYNNHEHGIDRSGLYRVVTQWEPMIFLPPVSEMTEEETEMYEPVQVTCPVCLTTCADEDGCHAGSEMRDHIEDHGFCRDCLGDWRLGRLRQTDLEYRDDPDPDHDANAGAYEDDLEHAWPTPDDWR